MASTEERIRKLVSENVEVDGKPLDSSIDFSTSLGDAGVSSIDIASFARVIQNEFGVKFTPQQCTEIQTLAQLVEFLDANAA